MKIYKIKVNGKVYEVELEEVSENSEAIVSAPKASTNVSVEDAIKAPLQGKIFKIPVKVGDKISSGDVVVVIEAMKMENEVKTSKTGTVKEILVSEGSEVDSGEPLIIVE